MRNIFDQYDSPENRLTHALGCCLQRDRRLLRDFVRWATGRGGVDWRHLEVLEQQVPGEPINGSDDEQSGLPDLWIHGDGDWALIVESKVQASISAGQLARHRRTAQRNGFTDVDLLVLAPEHPARPMADVVYRTWPDVYCWLRRQGRRSEWARCMAEYMTVAEARMTADGYIGDRPLTVFDGIPFGVDHPYNYREAKRLLKLGMSELRKRKDLRKLGMDPEGDGRPAITGKDGAAVWDFIPLKAARGKGSFTRCPHLTMAIQAHRMIAIVTLPNAVPAAMRNNVVGLGAEGFERLIADVERGVTKAISRIRGAYAFIEVVQRHYPTQRSNPVVDARLEFDLRTAVGARRSRVHRQPQWLQATFDALQAKRSNLQVAVGAAIPYGDPAMCSRGVLDVIAGVWVGCKPWLRTTLARR